MATCVCVCLGEWWLMVCGLILYLWIVFRPPGDTVFVFSRFTYNTPHVVAVKKSSRHMSVVKVGCTFVYKFGYDVCRRYGCQRKGLKPAIQFFAHVGPAETSCEYYVYISSPFKLILQTCNNKVNSFIVICAEKQVARYNEIPTLLCFLISIHKKMLKRCLRGRSHDEFFCALKSIIVNVDAQMQE